MKFSWGLLNERSFALMLLLIKLETCDELLGPLAETFYTPSGWCRRNLVLSVAKREAWSIIIGEDLSSLTGICVHEMFRPFLPSWYLGSSQSYVGRSSRQRVPAGDNVKEFPGHNYPRICLIRLWLQYRCRPRTQVSSTSTTSIFRRWRARNYRICGSPFSGCEYFYRMFFPL